MDRLDNYDILPSGMNDYLGLYGWHFSRKMCEWAVSKMRDRNNNKMTMRSKEQVENILKSHGVEIENDYGYDKAWKFSTVRFIDFRFIIFEY